MKKILVLLLALLFAAPQYDAIAKSQLEKQREKEYKTKMKEYKKEGWKLFASSRSLDVALLTHYDKLNQMGDEAYELVGVASAFKSKNVGKQMAQNSAATSYASQAGSKVRGRVVSDMFGDADNPDAEFDKFYAAYERLVEKEIKGEMRESFSVIRDNGNGTFELQTYYIISEEAATKARMRAYENALRESEAAQRYAQKVADFVREGFNPAGE